MANPIEDHVKEYIQKKEELLMEQNRKKEEAQKIYKEAILEKMKNDNMEDVKKCISLGNKICNWFKISGKYDREIETRIKREVLTQELLTMSKISTYNYTSDQLEIPTQLERENIEQDLINVRPLTRLDKFKLLINDKCNRFNIPILCDMMFIKTMKELKDEHNEYCRRLYINNYELMNILSIDDRSKIIKTIIDEKNMGAKINMRNGYVYFDVEEAKNDK